MNAPVVQTYCSHLNDLDIIHRSYREDGLLCLLTVRAAQSNTVKNSLKPTHSHPQQSMNIPGAFEHISITWGTYQ